LTVHDLLTAESLASFNAAKITAAGNAPALFAQFENERSTYLAAYPELARWNNAIVNFDFTTASDAELLASLVDDGFLAIDNDPTEQQVPDSAVFRFKLIAPKIVDAFMTGAGMKVDYAYNSLHVCFRRAAIPATVIVPTGWRDTVLIDCEIFELPYRVAPDNFDDREKIHVYYLAGMLGDQFRAEPVYIGIGTGEAYGPGPTRRSSNGRFRFYRYDIKDNFHFEHIADRVIREWTQENVHEVPAGSKIEDDQARILLGRSVSDSSFMCLADPQVCESYKEWIARNPHNRLVFRLLEMRKKHENIAPRSCDLPAPEGRLDAALTLAEELHRYFFIAWQHPSRLTDAEGLKLYYKELPEFRRVQYEIYRVKPEFLGETAPSDGLAIPEVLFDDGRRAVVDRLAPGSVQKFDAWLKSQLVLDLYHYGNHPELRLCSALVFMRLLRSKGLWAEAIRATYDRRLNYLDLSVERLTHPKL
jgi:hypothetical protein